MQTQREVVLETNHCDSGVDNLLTSSQSESDQFVNRLFTALIDDCIIQKKQMPYDQGQALRVKLSQVLSSLKREKHALLEAFLLYCIDQTPINIELHLQPSGFLLLGPSSHRPEGATFDQEYFLEMLSLALVIGLYTSSLPLLEQAVQMAFASLRLLNRHGKLPIGMFSRGSSQYLPSEMQMLYCTSLKTVDRMTRGDIPSTLFKGLSANNTAIKHPLVSHLIKALDCLEPSYLIDQQPLDTHDLSFVNLLDSHASCMIDCCGVQTALGFYETDGCEIAAFGFQHPPLGDLNSFGTYRMEGLSKEDFFVECKDNTSIVKGWTRLLDAKSTKDNPSPGSIFAYLTIKKCKKTLDIHAQLECTQLLNRYYWVFFVRAEAIQVKGYPRIEQKTLKKYFGKCRPLSIISSHKQLQIESDLSHEMQVIPLEGEKAFWGADFLISYELTTCDQKAAWKLSD